MQLKPREVRQLKRQLLKARRLHRWIPPPSTPEGLALKKADFEAWMRRSTTSITMELPPLKTMLQRLQPKW